MYIHINICLKCMQYCIIIIFTYRINLFILQDVIETRQSSLFQSKYDIAVSFKHKGNEYLQAKDSYAAIIQYEKALSIWEWLESKLKNWKQNVRYIHAAIHMYPYTYAYTYTCRLLRTKISPCTFTTLAAKRRESWFTSCGYLASSTSR